MLKRFIESKFKFSYVFLYLLIPMLILIPKSISTLFGFIPVRLFLISIFLLLFFTDLCLGRIEIKRIKFKFLIFLISIFLLFTIPSVRVSQNIIISIYTFIKFFIAFSFFLAVLHLNLSKHDIKKLIYVFSFSLVLLLVYGIYEYFFSTTLFKIGIDYIEGARGRIQASFFNTIYLGIFLNISLALLLYFTKKTKGLLSFVVSLILIALFVNLTLTFTRTSYLVFWGIMGLTLLFDIRLFRKAGYWFSVVSIISIILVNGTFRSFTKYSFELPLRYISNIDELLLLLPSVSDLIKPDSNDPADTDPSPTDPVYPIEIQIADGDIYVKQIGLLYDFEVEFFPLDASQRSYKVISSSPDVIQVINENQFYVLQYGASTLSVETENGRYDSINVFVERPDSLVELESISLKNSHVIIDVDKYYLAKPIFKPANASDLRLTWRSLDENIATVDQYGMIYSVALGSTTIQGENFDSTLAIEVKVTVEKPQIDYSAIHRREFSVIANQIAKDHLFTGVGFGTYIDYMNSDLFAEKYPDYKYPKTHPHSAIVLLFAETGIIAMISFVLIMFYILFKGFVYYIRFRKSSDDGAMISRYVPGLIIGFVLVNLLAENAVYDSQVFPLFLLIVGLIYSYLETGVDGNRKVIAIASQGGHIFELLQIAKVFEVHDYLVVTEKSETTIGLKSKYGKRIRFLVYETRKHFMRYVFVFLWNSTLSTIIYFSHMPEFIVTTGTHTAVPMCIIGKIFGSKIIYIETMANIRTRSMSGTIIYPISDLFIVQWKEMLKLYKKAVYGGLIIK